MAENQGNIQQTKNKKKTDKNAFKFLCCVIALVITFISVVCVYIDKRNDTLKAENNSESRNETQGEAPDNTQKTPAENNTEEDSTNSSTTDASTTAPATTEAAAVVTPVGSFENPKIITINPDTWYKTLVNSYYRIPDDYKPDLVYVCGTGERLDSKVAVHYEKMFNAAAKEGIYLTPCSGYRSYATQEKNYNNKVNYYKNQGYSEQDAKVKAATIIMPPGSSEHNLGYAMDIVCVDEWFEDTEQFRWLTENAADYGFIMRYPKDKQDITRVIYEPWHWRYVGVELAKELKASGQVLEEYFGVA